jgi:hypothetical protein
MSIPGYGIVTLFGILRSPSLVIPSDLPIDRLEDDVNPFSETRR